MRTPGAEVIAMPQKSNDPGRAESSVPQEPDDELEMAEDDDEDFEDDEDVDDSESDEDGVEE